MKRKDVRKRFPVKEIMPAAIHQFLCKHENRDCIRNVSNSVFAWRKFGEQQNNTV